MKTWRAICGLLLALLVLAACGGAGNGAIPPTVLPQGATPIGLEPSAAVSQTAATEMQATMAGTAGATADATTSTGLVATTDTTAAASGGTTVATGAPTTAATLETTSAATTGATTDATMGATTGATTEATTGATMGATTDATMAATSGTASGSGQPVADLKGRKLTIGSDTTYPPMESVDDQKQVVGFDVDMANEIAKLTNSTVTFQTFPNFDAIFAALANKEFDGVISSVSITDERKKIIDFSDPYLAVGQAITVGADNTTITTADSLKTAKLVGVQGGTTGEQAAKDAGVTDAQIKRYDTIDLAFQDLANGAVDVVIADGPPSVNYASKSGGKIKVVGQPFTTENYAIALQKGDTELLTAVNAALKEMKVNGTMQQLVEKWNLQNVAKLP